jgi:hypothetical protein
MNNLVAYDLDGVFISDCDRFPKVGELAEFYALATYMQPLFKPEGEWAILTARFAEHRPVTMDWVNRHFVNKPSRVWHERTDADQTPAEYKADVINKCNIKYYIESDAGIVDYLVKHTNATIIHFDTFCKLKFTPENLIDPLL